MTLAPTTTPLVFDRFSSTSGRGVAIDVAVSGVSDLWEVGVDIRGIGNRIKWTGFEGERVALPSLTQALQLGFDFITTPLTPPNSSVEIKLPVNYRGYLAYSGPTWTALGKVSRGFQGTNFHAGLGRRFGIIELAGRQSILKRPLASDRGRPPQRLGSSVVRYRGIFDKYQRRARAQTRTRRVASDQLSVTCLAYGDHLPAGIPGPDPSLARVGSGERTAIKASGSTRALLSLTDQCR